MRRIRFIIPVAVMAVGMAGTVTARAVPASPDPQYDRQDGWDAPPEFNDIQRRGFHDGVQGARKDYENHRQPAVDNRDEYRHPDDVPHRMRHAYREAFRRGYQTAASRLWNGGPGPGSYQQPQGPPPSWEWGMRGLENDAARRGFHEGTESARDDYQNRRRPDPDDRREYRNPPVPPRLQDEFRSGFMRGYEVAMSQLSGEQAWQFQGERWDAPGRFSEIQRQGFQDGIEGARKDRGNGRPPDPNNRDEYRDPRVGGELRHEYREGFRRGYEMAAARLWGGQ